MDTYCVYILYSKSVDRYYIGYSIDMLSRLDQHNRHV
ncbi:GIY-YIG nuclease family protein, partial [Belliella kenyensis]